MHNGEKLAVVLGGGGSKGSYEVGVWQAMEELSIPYHVVTGTSVGALNGALMVQGDLDEALHMWNHLDNSSVMSEIPALSDAPDALKTVYSAFVGQLLKNGGVDITPLESTVRNLVSETRLRKSSIEFGIVTVELPAMKPIERFLPEIPQGQIADFLLASAACFPAFKPREVDGCAYIDGGYTNNIPVDLALRANQKVDRVLAIDVEGIGIVRETPSDVPIDTLRCYWDLGSILVFDKKQSRRNIRLGYLDAMKLFGDYEGCAYTMAVGEAEKLEQKILPRLSVIYYRLMDLMSEKGKKQVSSIVAGRIISAATHRRGLSEEQMNLSTLLMGTSELAAELLLISPTKIYTANGFIEEIQRAYQLSLFEKEAYFSTLDKIGTGKLSHLFGKIKKDLVLPSVCHLLHRYLVNKNDTVPIEVLATFVPKELLAAIFIETIV